MAIQVVKLHIKLTSVFIICQKGLPQGSVVRWGGGTGISEKISLELKISLTALQIGTLPVLAIFQIRCCWLCSNASDMFLCGKFFFVIAGNVELTDASMQRHYYFHLIKECTAEHSKALFSMLAFELNQIKLRDRDMSSDF